MLVGLAKQEKTGQVGELVEDLPRVGMSGEDWTRGVTEEDLAILDQAYLQKTGAYS